MNRVKRCVEETLGASYEAWSVSTSKLLLYKRKKQQNFALILKYDLH